MKRFLTFSLALALVLSLAACGEAPTAPSTPNTSNPPESTPTPSETGMTEPPIETDPPSVPEEPITAPRFTREEFPRLDGSTATAPLAVAMAALMLGESEEDVTPLINFSRTTQSYYNLLFDNADLLIVSEGNEEVYAYREELGFAWEQTPFAMDAFVFVVNEKNPVESLTIDQIRGIYTGQITNWSQVGGADEPIIPLQRNPEAGSQSLMEKLVMQGTPMMEAPKEYIADSMGGLMEAVRGFDASAGAIGYSVYYYAEEMRAAQGLKLLKIEGVEPEPNAIRSGAYPLTNPYYVVIPANPPEDSPIRIIRDWLLSEGGQRLAASMGYVSIMDLPTAPRETKPLVGSRLFESYTDTLVPGDYGTLIPYAGLRVSSSEFAASGCLYGLMTREGQVVVDPVYTSFRFFGDLIVLTRAIDGQERVVVAARSGAWCSDLEYLGASGGDEGLILYKEDSVTLYRPDGTPAGTYTAEQMGVTREQLRYMRLGPMEGPGMGEWLDDKLAVLFTTDSGYSVLYFDLADETLKVMDTDSWYSLYTPHVTREPADRDAWYIFDVALGEDAPAIMALGVWDGTNPYTITFLYEDGTPIPGLIPINPPSQSVNLIDGLIERLDVNMAEYYDMNTMELVFRTYLGYEED